MATLTQNFHWPRFLRLAIVQKADVTLAALLPRRCMVVSVGLFLAGLGIPLLMTMGLLPLNLLFGFIGFALTATGGVLALTLCGEI